MSREEVDAILAATDAATRSGQRDRLLFSFLYNTGARISEALQLRPQDLLDDAVLLRGKGRKDRAVPVWPGTERLLRQWYSLSRKTLKKGRSILTIGWRGEEKSPERG
jgi:site-specific recombinase XerD